MPFRIRTKLIIAFLAIIIPYMVIAGTISLYNLNIILKGVHKVEAIAGEMRKSHRLQLALDTALMPVNDYIITGEKRYMEEFQKASVEVERWLKGLEGELADMVGAFPAEVKEEREILKDVRASWQKIAEISSEIFAIQNPVGNSNAAALMEEMDYKWAYPAIERLRRWQEIDEEEYREAHEESERALRRVVTVIIAGGVILLFFGGSFAVFYSRIFVTPIETLHEGADAIATGDFKIRLDIKTGDEIEQLADAMNEMAAQLDSFYGTLERQVEERTRELKESETRFHNVLETAKDAVICIEQGGSIYLWNNTAEEMFGYSANEAIGKDIHSLIVPERLKEKAYTGLNEFSKTGTGPVVGKTIEIVGMRKDGTEFPVELSISAMNIKDKWHAVGIIRDITERKKTEDKIKENLDCLERFQKVAVKREFRIKELMDEVEGLKARIVELEGVDKE